MITSASPGNLGAWRLNYDEIEVPFHPIPLDLKNDYATDTILYDGESFEIILTSPRGVDGPTRIKLVWIGAKVHKLSIECLSYGHNLRFFAALLTRENADSLSFTVLLEASEIDLTASRLSVFLE